MTNNNSKNKPSILDYGLEIFPTQLTSKAFSAIAAQTFEKLGLKLTYGGYSRKLRAAKTKKVLFRSFPTNELEVIYDGQNISVDCKAQWKRWEDNNNQLIQSFIETFREIEKIYDPKANQEQKMDFEIWVGYELPEQLPPIQPEPTTTILPLLLTSFIAALLGGWAWAFFTIEFGYQFVLYEMATVFVFTQAFKFGIKKGHYIHLNSIRLIVLCSILLLLISNEYFLYLDFLSIKPTIDWSFFQFMFAKITAGLHLDGINTGMLGWLILWIVRIGVLFWYILLFVNVTVAVNQHPRIPSKVFDFVMYHLDLGLSDDEMRALLAEKGWTEKADQDEVFRAME